MADNNVYMSQSDYVKYRRNYVFAKMVDRYNELHQSHPERQISTNTAIMLRHEWLDVIKKKVEDGVKDIDPVAIFDEMIESDDKWRLVDYDSHEMWDMAGDSKEFDRITTHGQGLSSYKINNAIYVGLSNDGYIPISPYSEFSNHMNVLERGNEMCALKVSDLESIRGPFNSITPVLNILSCPSFGFARRYVRYYKNKGVLPTGADESRLLQNIYGAQYSRVGLYTVAYGEDDDIFVNRVVQTITDKDSGEDKVIECNFAYKYDGFGLSKLARFLEKDDLLAIKNCVKSANYGLIPSHAKYIPENVATQMSLQIDCLCEMCKYLDEHGYVYHIRQDVGDYRDQTMLLVEGTDLKCRALDLHSRDNLRFGAARITDKGVKYYFSAANNDNAEQADIRVTPNMAVSLLKYALGDKIEKRCGVNDKGELVVDTAGKFSENGSDLENQGMVRIKGNKSRCSLGKLSLWDRGYNTKVASSDVKSEDTELVIRTENKYVSPVYDFTKAKSPMKDENGADVYDENGNLVYASKGLMKQEVVLDKNGKVVRDESGEPTYKTTYLDTETWLKDCISSARENFTDDLNVDYIVDNFSKHIDKENPFEYEFSVNPHIASFQKEYVSVLEGKKDKLTLPKIKRVEEDVEQATQNNDTVEIGEGEFDHKVAVIRQHAQDLVNRCIGQYEVGADGYRFNPVLVTQYMQDGIKNQSIFVNRDNLKGAMKQLHILPDELFGEKGALETSFVRDLVYYDEASALSLEKKAQGNEFWTNIYNTVTDSLESNGVKIDKLCVDDNGIVHYEGYVNYGKASKGNKGANRDITVQLPYKIEGEIGQIFEPDERGVVKTHFAREKGSDIDYAFVPGYNGYIGAQVPGENKTLEQRTVLLGYEQLLSRAIRKNISFDIRTLSFIENVTVENLSVDEQMRLATKGITKKTIPTYELSQNERDKGFVKHISNSSALNKVYKHLYDERYDYDFEDKYLAQGVPQDVLDDIIKTQAGRVKYHSMFKQRSTTHAAFEGARVSEKVRAYDRVKTPYTLTGMRDMSILTDEGKGYFDNIATNMTTQNQGTIRYLAQGARVDVDGHIIPYNGSDDDMYKTALMANDVMKYASFDPADRQCMAFSNLLQCHSVVRDVNVAHSSVGGWNFDDGMVVSKSFADTHQIPAGHGDGDMRGLMVGDKLSDMHGNKGVIAAVVDPNMSDKDAIAKYGSTKLRDLFKNNEMLSIVQAPTYLPSRMNGGTGRELCASKQKYDLKLPDGSVVNGGISSMNIIITDKDADAKTSIYDDEAMKEGKGRKSSAQIAWSFSAKNCKQFMNEVYGTNDKTIANYKEYLLCLGMNMDSTTSKIMHQTVDDFDELDDDFKNRQVIDPGYESLCSDTNYRLPQLRFDDMTDTVLQNKGGFISLPFALTYPNGKEFLPADVLNSDNRVKVDIDTDRYESREEYLLPLLSYDLRVGSEFQDGSLVEHDYTRAYKRILENAVLYTAYKQSNVLLEGIGADDNIALLERMQTSSRGARINRFNSLSDDVKCALAQNAGVVLDNDNVDMDKILSNSNIEYITLVEKIKKFNEMPKKVKDALVESFVNTYNDGKNDVDQIRKTSVLSFISDNELNGEACYKRKKSFPDLTVLGCMSQILDPENISLVMEANDKECEFRVRNSQRHYDRDIVADIEDHKLCNKHNMYRDKIMSVKLPNSATAVWTANPTLDINQVAVSKEIADAINIHEGEGVLIWRDPALRTSNQRVMYAHIVDDIKGVAINPVMDKCFDGDFDGDTVAVVALSEYSARAKSELKRGFGVRNTLMDKGHLHDGVRGEYDLNIQDGLDIQMYLHDHQEGEAVLENLRVRANSASKVNEVEQKEKLETKQSDDMSNMPKKDNKPSVSLQELDKVVGDLSTFYKDAFDKSFGHALSFNSLQDYVNSVYGVCIKTGAKGNDKKFISACQWLGLDVDVKDGEVVVNNISDKPFGGDKGVLTEQNHEVQGATMTKAVGTGMAGMFSIRGYSALRELCGEAVLELTYPVTQGTLQVKHDAAKATNIFACMKKPLRDHWCGYKVILDEKTGEFKTCMEPNEKTNELEPVVATKKEWMSQFRVLYGENGLDVDFNPELVSVVCDGIQAVCGITDSDQMGNIEKECVCKNVLDHLAYDGLPGQEMFDNLCEVADNKQCLFDLGEDKIVNAFAPNQLKANYILSVDPKRDTITTSVGSRYDKKAHKKKDRVKTYSTSTLTKRNVLNKEMLAKSMAESNNEIEKVENNDNVDASKDDDDYSL